MVRSADLLPTKLVLGKKVARYPGEQGSGEHGDIVNVKYQALEEFHGMIKNRPPEVLAGKGWRGDSADIWCLGSALVELYLGRPIVSDRV